jgi:diguanylate cyclase (GGDEF)-like protein
VFGTQPKPRRGVLLIVVFGVLLVLVGITATAQALMVSAYASASTLSSVVDGDAATVRGFVRHGLDGLDPANPDPAITERISLDLETLLAKGEIVRAEMRDPSGRVLASSDPTAVGTTRRGGSGFDTAAAGSPSVAIVDSTAADTDTADLPPTVIREYLPLRQGERTLLVVAVWRDAQPALAGLDGLRRDVVIVIITAAIIAAAVLYLVFRAAQTRINRQTEALLLASRTDGLTGTLNHGALVERLAMSVEKARDGEGDGRLGVALVDIDNFRLLNDVHGHGAGDQVLVAVAATLRDALPAEMAMGRYGPDEFLVIAEPGGVDALPEAIDDFRASLAELAIQFDSTERLPVTVSIGICRYPEAADSVTALLTTAATVLQEAKASGGGAVRIARADGEELPQVASFDVLQGLVFAIDTKDRYTKRHSEDVARYAVFLGQRIGLDEASLGRLHVAGLLHDVGKIGIPDAVLRKPGKLTADEYEVVKQHVALGDLIVRDLPDLDEIRAGIRHHHERWDGRGYLHALAADDIPFIARILAVGDAFSAMTTTRPYRKALDVREALVRLGDAAGSQLDERLVIAFIRGIETASDAPLPGVPAAGPSLWTPKRRVA